MRTRTLALLALFALTAPAAVASAQDATQEGRAMAPRYTFGVNPLGIPFGLFSAEYERALTNGFSFGVGGSIYDGIDSDSRHAWAEGKLIYYPNETPLRGFAIGITAGVHRTAGPVAYDLFSNSDTRRTESAPTAGVILDYNWLLGRRKRFLVGLGIGAKRTLRHVDTSVSPLEPVYADGRLILGYAF